MVAGLLGHRFVQATSAFFAGSRLGSLYKSGSGNLEQGPVELTQRLGTLGAAPPPPPPRRLLSLSAITTIQTLPAFERNKLVMVFLRAVILSPKVSSRKSDSSCSFSVFQEARQEREIHFRLLDSLKNG